MANFERAVQHTLDLEGGYVNDPADPGGRTIYGISERSFPEEWSIGPPTLQRAKEIYKLNFWNPLNLDTFVNQSVALEVFDTAVNCGPRKAGEFLQVAYNFFAVKKGLPPLVVDGAIGPKTIRAVNDFCRSSASNCRALWAKMNVLQALYYEAIKNDRFIIGWYANRVFGEFD